VEPDVNSASTEKNEQQPRNVFTFIEFVCAIRLSQYLPLSIAIGKRASPMRRCDIAAANRPSRAAVQGTMIARPT
jgi:hypothetical protein